MDESAEAVARSVLALWLSGGALLVALGAAAFSGWQAVTEHLARVRPLRADWVLEFVEYSARRGGDPSGWFLRNTGGSTAVDVTLRVVDTPEAAAVRDRGRSLLTAAGPIPPGRVAGLRGTEKRYAPGQWFRRADDPSSHLWSHVETGRDGKPAEEGAFRAEEQYATVEWTDERQKRRTKRIPIY